MKRNLLFPVLTFVCASMLLFSCSSSRYSRYEKRSPGQSLSRQLNKGKTPVNIFNGSGGIENEIKNAEADIATVPAPAVTAENILPEQNVKGEEKIHVPQLKNTVASAQKVEKPSVIRALAKNKVERKLNRTLSNSADPLSEVKGSRDLDILEVICAIFIPPLAVYLHDDGLSTNFWIDLILTILFWIPGVIFAFLCILDLI